MSRTIFHEKLFSIRQVAGALGLSTRSVRRRIDLGAIQAIDLNLRRPRANGDKARRTLRVTQSELDRYING